MPQLRNNPTTHFHRAKSMLCSSMILIVWEQAPKYGYKTLLILYIVCLNEFLMNQNLDNKNNNNFHLNFWVAMKGFFDFVSFVLFSDDSWFVRSQTYIINYDALHEYEVRIHTIKLVQVGLSTVLFLKTNSVKIMQVNLTNELPRYVKYFYYISKIGVTSFIWIFIFLSGKMVEVRPGWCMFLAIPKCFIPLVFLTVQQSQRFYRESWVNSTKWVILSTIKNHTPRTNTVGFLLHKICLNRVERLFQIELLF